MIKAKSKAEGQINLEWSYLTHFQTAEWFYNLIGENYHSGHFLPKARSNNSHSDLKKNKTNKPRTSTIYHTGLCNHCNCYEQ